MDTSRKKVNKQQNIKFKMFKAKDAVKAEEWVRDGAVEVNRDEKELISDLRKGLLTGDNDAVIRWETAMLNPVHAIKSGQSLSHWKSPPTPTPTTNGEVETN